MCNDTGDYEGDTTELVMISNIACPAVARMTHLESSAWSTLTPTKTIRSLKLRGVRASGFGSEVEGPRIWKRWLLIPRRGTVYGLGFREGRCLDPLGK